MIIDLKTGVPFMFSNKPQTYTPKYEQSFKCEIPFIKKVFKNTSRFLGITRPHHIVFDHSLKDI
jgi:hypothetical protein